MDSCLNEKPRLAGKVGALYSCTKGIANYLRISILLTSWKDLPAPIPVAPIR